MAQSIALTRGLASLVDDEDYERISAHKWFAFKNGNHWYAARWLIRGRVLQLMHREVLGLVSDDGTLVDHESGDGLDNRRQNLRLADKSKNAANAPKRMRYGGRPPSSQFKGVCWHKAAGKWMASIRSGGQSHYLGLFADEGEAAAAYNQAALDTFGAFALLNELSLRNNLFPNQLQGG